MTELNIRSKDDIVMKLLHYFVTKEDYKPIILRGVENEIWLENLDNKVKLIRINTNYLHNKEQYESDLKKVTIIMKSIKKKTFSINMNILNIIANASEYVEVIDDKNILSVKVNKITDLKKNKQVNKYFPSIDKNISSKKADALDFFNMTKNLNKKSIDDEKKFSNLFKTDKPYVTYALILVNILVFLIMLNPNLFNIMVSRFASHSYLVRTGEYYRLFTYIFLHGNLMHIFFNMYALYIVGPLAEKYYGKWKFLLIYLLSGILGGLFSCVYNDGFSLGASGAIFGLFGSLLYFSYNFRATIDGFIHSPILPTIVINLLLGFMIPNVDVAGHIGGLIGGVLLSMGLGIYNKTKKEEKVNGILVYTILAIFMIYMLLNK